MPSSCELNEGVKALPGSLTTEMNPSPPVSECDEEDEYEAMSLFYPATSKPTSTINGKLRFVFANGRSEITVIVQKHGEEDRAFEDRVGPVMSGVISCTPDDDGTHKVLAPELSCAVMASPLMAYLRWPEDTFWIEESWTRMVDLEMMAASYAAAYERLAVAGFVRLVERWIVVRIRDGDHEIEDVSKAFRGFPRIASLCDNYELVAGRKPPKWRPANGLRDDVSIYGVELVMSLSDMNNYWVIADLGMCRELQDDHAICKRISDLNPLNEDDDDDDMVLVYELRQKETRIVRPAGTSTWLPKKVPLPILEDAPSLSRFFQDKVISLLVVPSNERGPPPPGYFNVPLQMARVDHGKILYSRDAASDYIYSGGDSFRNGYSEECRISL